MNALIQVPVCPLMTAPSDRSELSDEVLYGMSVQVSEAPGDGWCHVTTHYGYTGYAPEACLLPGESAAAAWSASAKKVVLRKNVCDIQAAPRVQSRPLLSLPRGALVQPVGDPDGGWQKVRLCDGREGYTRSSFLGEHYTKPASDDEAAFRRLLTRTALLYAGTQYRWGGKTPLGIDCSGLVFMAYLLNGVIIWRDAQIREGYPVHEIDRRAVKRGDLLFFPGHAAMYLDRGLYIHSTGAPGSDGVTINSLDPAAPNFRADLAESLLKVGSIF